MYPSDKLSGLKKGASAPILKANDAVSWLSVATTISVINFELWADKIVFSINDFPFIDRDFPLTGITANIFKFSFL